MNNINIFVFGSSGYIGSNLLVFLKKFYKNVYGISRSEKSQDFTYDINNIEKFNYDIFNSKSIIFFCTAISSPDLCEIESKKCFELNVIKTQRIIKLVLNRKSKLIFLSSDNVYRGGKVRYNEKSNSIPLNKYGKWKKKIEDRFKHYSNFKSIRLSQVISSENNFYKIHLDKLKKGKIIYGYINIYRCTIDIKILFKIFVFIIENWSKVRYKIVNAGGNKMISRYDLFLNLFDKEYHNLIIPMNAPKDFLKNRPNIINMDSSYIQNKIKKLK